MLKRLLNRSEEQTYSILREGCDPWDARVFAKVRLADVMPIDRSGLSSGDYGFALRAHLDFLATDSDFTPLFGVEFDGLSHGSARQRERDCIKNRLCEKFDLPLLRVNSRYLYKKYREWNLISLFVEYWFLERSFYEAQKAGSVPWDEIFDTMSVYKLPDRDLAFPLSLAYDAHWEVRKLAAQGQCWSPGLSSIISRDSSGLYHALGYVVIDAKSCVLAELKMREQQFTLRPSELLGDLVGLEVYEALRKGLLQQSVRRSLRQLDQRIEFYTHELDQCSAAICSRGLPPGSYRAHFDKTPQG